MSEQDFPDRYLAAFHTLQSLKPPSPVRLLARVLTGLMVGMALFLTVTPWVQTAPGKGTLTALNPADRLQTVNALTSGRIKHWYVREGSRIKKDDPVVEIVDNDPQIIERLTAERDAVQRKFDAARMARETSRFDYDRKDELYKKGLSSRKDYEEAKISFNNHLAKEEEVASEMQRINVKLSRQHTQLVRAPSDGIVVNISAGYTATFVKEGTPLATFVPDHVERAVELYVAGNDVPLVYPGRQVRLQFEGWPVIQFSGWPEMAIGTFKGIVSVVDPSISGNGRFRVMVKEDPAAPWPDNTFLRFGAKVRGWVLLNTVSLGYEFWRQINSFPPEYGTLLQGMRGVPGLGAGLLASGLDMQKQSGGTADESKPEDDGGKK